MDGSNQNKPPKGVISVKEAKALNDEWTKTRAAAMNQCISTVTGGKITKDNRSSWWSLKDIEDYIEYAKSQTKEKVTGLRVYCGAYSDGDCYSTSFIVPTTTVKGSLGKDDVEEEGEEDLPIDPLNKGSVRIPPGDGYNG